MINNQKIFRKKFCQIKKREYLCPHFRKKNSTIKKEGKSMGK